jgi:O-antigen/teichoic acid export membrane protein
VQRVQTSLQEGHLTQIWAGIGSLLSLFALLLFVKLKLTMPWILCALYGIPSVIVILNYIYEFWHRKIEYRPDFSFGNFHIGIKILRIGIVFVIVQVSSMLLNSSTNLIIVNKLGISEVADFSIVTRFVSIISGPIAMIFPAILPSVNDAIVQEDHSWIKRLVRRALFFVIVYASITTFFIYLFGKPFLQLWMGDNFVMKAELLLPIMVYSIYLQLNSLISYLMLSIFYIKKLLFIYPLAVIASIFSKYLLVDCWGATGILWGEIIMMTSLFFIPSLYFLKANKHL